MKKSLKGAMEIRRNTQSKTPTFVSSNLGYDSTSNQNLSKEFAETHLDVLSWICGCLGLAIILR